MAIASNVYTGPYTGNGTQTAFAFDFTAVSASDVSVQVNGATISSNLYVVSISDAGTGTVTFSVPPASGASVLLLLTPDFAQETVYENEGAYKLSTVNATNRRAAIRANYLNATFGRTFLVPFGETAPAVASLVGAEGKVLGVVGGTITPVDNTVVAAESAAASAAASAVTATAEASEAIIQAAAATTQAIVSTNSADESANSAAQALQAAATAQGFSNTLDSAPSALPYEVTALSGGVGTGTGGTDGVYNLGVTGGPAGFKATVTITGGTIASYDIVNPGISTSNTAPTLSLSGVTGLTGATAPTATVGTIPVNRVFLAPSSDGMKNLAWYNKSGTGLNQFPDLPGVQFSYPLVGQAPYSWFSTAADETGALMRWRLGRRLLAVWDVTRGFVPSRITLPALQTKVDDDTSVSLVNRLMGAFWGATFKEAPSEVGSVYRLRLGSRVLGTWDTIQGFFPQRMTVPATAVMSDQPSVLLADRLGGSGGAAGNASYTVLSQLASTGKFQIVSLRKADSATFFLTDGTANATEPAITSDGANVLFWDASANRVMYQPIEGGAASLPVVPYGVVDCWGDSLTQGVGATPAVPFTTVWRGNLPQQIARLLAGSVSTVNNYGVGGQISAEIAARQGGAPCLISVTGNTIPASGAVTVTAYSVDLLLQGTTSGAITVNGTLAGIPGTLSGSNSGARGTSTYTFTRTTAGSSTPCPANTPFIPDNGVSSRPNIQILTYGRNDSTASVTPILNALAASAAYQTALEKRYLVGGVLAAIGETLATYTSINNAIAAVYGARFVDLNAAPSVGEMAAIGFVPDSYGAYANGNTDAGDIAAGFIPTGMRNSAFNGGTDYLHLNEFGYALWALRYYRKIQSLGWFPGLTVI